MSLLLLDDEDVFFKIISILSKNMGFEFFYAKDIHEAKKILQDRDISLAIIDYTLTELDGVTFNRYVRENFPHIKTAIFTGAPEFIEKEQLDTFTYHIGKDELVDFIREYFKK